MTLQKFLDTFLGGSWGYPDNNQFKGECLSIVKIYIKECFSINPPTSGTNSAYGYWSKFPSPLGEKFEKVLDTDDLIPLKGWIAIWKPWTGNLYGHIAICGDNSTKYILDNYAQNWSSKTFKEELTDYDNVIGYLKPKESIIPDMTEDQKRALSILESFKTEFNHGNLEGAISAAVGAAKDTPTKDKQIQTLQDNVLNLTKNVKDLTDRVMALESELKANLDLVASQQKDNLSAKGTVLELNQTIEAITSEKNKYKAWYETALKTQTNKLTGWQLIKLGINLLVKKGK